MLKPYLDINSRNFLVPITPSQFLNKLQSNQLKALVTYQYTQFHKTYQAFSVKADSSTYKIKKSLRQNNSQPQKSQIFPVVGLQLFNFESFSYCILGDYSRLNLKSYTTTAKNISRNQFDFPNRFVHTLFQSTILAMSTNPMSIFT